MTVQERAAQLADSLAQILAATQRNADTIRRVQRHGIVWSFADHLRAWHLMSPHLMVNEEESDEPLRALFDDIDDAEAMLLDGREPWVHLHRRERFRKSALALLEAHGIALHDVLLRARVIAEGGAA